MMKLRVFDLRHCASLLAVFSITVSLFLTPSTLVAQAVDTKPVASEPAPGTFANGATGPLVEDLQRTLNDRLNPSPRLDVDGHFGESTQQAVEKFQQQNKLEATGFIDAQTWQALGVLVTAPPVPMPDVVNRQKLKTAKTDPLDGPPYVSCKAWAIVDGTTGKLLWGHHEDRPLNNASTTKIMTAYLVLKLAENDPSILAEEVAFSERADNTRGSSAKIRAGEKLIVRELLYGLLLPSGNDASVALAETFGVQFDPPEGNPNEKDPLPRFVAQMNRTALALGMKNTTYKNPHGLDATGHHSSARDLMTLAHAAFQMATFQEYVKTRQHGCTLVGKEGYRRNIVWRNTNQLLKIEGYNGVKTGTTPDAGACLVSSSERDGQHLMLAILGATSKDGRYVDSRNLYRWAWKQREAK